MYAEAKQNNGTQVSLASSEREVTFGATKYYLLKNNNNNWCVPIICMDVNKT